MMNQIKNNKMRILFATVAGVMSSSLWCADGVTEINQLCAEQTGCFAGDEPGYPVTITDDSPHNFVLTSNLDLSGLPVDPDNVDFPDAVILSARQDQYLIDLNGFEVIGPNQCYFVNPVSDRVTDCDYSEAEVSGIKSAASTSVASLTISNGTVRNMLGIGISCTRNCKVENVVSKYNGVGGFSMVMDSSLTDTHASYNGDYGMVIGNGSVVRNSTARGNSLHGIVALLGSVIDASFFIDNGGIGVFCSSCMITNSYSGDNGAGGVVFFQTSVSGGNWFDSDDMTYAVNGTPSLELKPDMCDDAACAYTVH